jgi:protein involved in polysaccharide export with SLBB domain
MKTNLLLIVSILFAAVLSVSAADAPPETQSVEARLTAIEQQLSRIEALLRASTPAATPPQATAGQIKATIMGQINRPGVYALDADSPLASLVAVAQGCAQHANQKKISVTAKDGTKTVVDLKANPVSYIVRDGDVVTVPEAFYNY